MRAQLRYIKANPGNADVIFNNGNFGFQLALANIRESSEGLAARPGTCTAEILRNSWTGLFCYIIESSYMLSFALQIAGSVYGYWMTHRRAESRYKLVSKLAPIFPTALTIGLLQTPAVHQSFLTYMIIANAQSVFCCAASMVLLILILVKYVNTKRQLESWRSWSTRKWKGVRSSRSFKIARTQDPHRNSRVNESSRDTTDHEQSRSSSWSQKAQHMVPAIYDSWLVTRLAILTVMLTGFILASVLTHLPQQADVERDSHASEPDLSPGRASSNIVGYMPGVTPSLVLFIVFGTTRPLRLTMYDRLVPKALKVWLQKRRQRSSLRPVTPPPWTPDEEYHPYLAIPLQSPPFAHQRSGSALQSPQPLAPGGKSKFRVRVDTGNSKGGSNVMSDEVAVSPLLENELYHGNWR